MVFKLPFLFLLINEKSSDENNKHMTPRTTFYPKPETNFTGSVTAVTFPSDFAPASSKDFLDIQATIECGFTLKHVHDMTRTYSTYLFLFFNIL